MLPFRAFLKIYLLNTREPGIIVSKVSVSFWFRGRHMLYFFSSDTHVPFLIPRQNQGRTQQQETENDLTKSIKVVFSNLLESKSLPKRKLDDALRIFELLLNSRFVREFLNAVVIA